MPAPTFGSASLFRPQEPTRNVIAVGPPPLQRNSLKATGMPKGDFPSDHSALLIDAPGIDGPGTEGTTHGGTLTWMSSPSTRTSKRSTFTLGLSHHLPSWTQNRPACQGQVTTPPSRYP